MRFVIALDTTLRLLRERSAVPPQHALVAPTLLRSDVLAALFRSASRQEIDRHEAGARLDHMRALRIRLLGDRVLQKVAWDVALRLGWDDTFPAEYVALTKLQADAFVTLDEDLARTVRTVVPVATYAEMLA
jgi:predicted nucleic acid-binding protein